jgi:hypothetical protein
MKTIDITDALADFGRLIDDAVISVNGVPKFCRSKNRISSGCSNLATEQPIRCQAGVLAQNSSKARMSSPAICWAVACSMM